MAPPGFNALYGSSLIMSLFHNNYLLIKNVQQLDVQDIKYSKQINRPNEKLGSIYTYKNCREGTFGKMSELHVCEKQSQCPTVTLRSCFLQINLSYTR